MGECGLPRRPEPPPCREIHYGLFGFAGNAHEYASWRTEPWWRKALGMTAVDRKRRADRADG